FSLAFRGYRMSEVDALLARLATQLEGEADQEPATERAEPAEAFSESREDDVPPG
ncbi:MAG: hypothetical protein JWN84_1044, partial [Nocardioides sp.]|nr:hypothetical protein [Nocardioides sp.]